MERKGKRLAADAVTLAMLCTAATGFAANTASITQIRVLDMQDQQVGETYTKDSTDISLNPSQLLEVTIQLASDTTLSESDMVTFLSHLTLADGTELGDSNIQYIDQQAAGTGTVTVKFRPRTSIGANNDGVGTFIGKVGGSDVADVQDFSYAVAKAVSDMTVTATETNKIYTDDTTTNIAFTITNAPAAITGVSIGEVALATDGTAYTYEYTAETKTATLTILNGALVKTVGTHTVTITAQDYNNGEGSYLVEERAVTPPDLTEEEAKAALESVTIPAADDNGTVTLTTTVQAGDKQANVTYALDGTPSGVTLTADNKLQLTEGTFAAKADITVTVAGQTKQESVYLIPKDTVVSYGNIGLVSVGGKDAFKTNDDYTTALTNKHDELLATRVDALNITLGRTNGTSVPQFENTLDYDQNGTLTLTEYRIFKLMLDGDPLYTPTNIAEARAQWLEQHPNN